MSVQRENCFRVSTYGGGGGSGCFKWVFPRLKVISGGATFMARTFPAEYIIRPLWFAAVAPPRTRT
jgi:hypothetical protein